MTHIDPIPPTGTTTMSYRALAGTREEPTSMFRVAQIAGASTYHELWLDIDDQDVAYYIVVPESGPYELLKRWAERDHEVRTWTFTPNDPTDSALGATAWVLEQVAKELYE